MPTKSQRLQRITSLIHQLQGLTKLNAIASLGKAEHDWLFDNYPEGSAGTFISSEYIPAITKAFPPSPGTELGDLECWQKVKGQMVKRHIIVPHLKPTKDEWNGRNKPTRDGAIQNADQKLPCYPQPIIDKATELLKSDNWAELAAGLIALTGRRPTEVVWCGRFKSAGKYSLIFSGQLKKGEIDEEPFEIPTLIEAKKVLAAFKRLEKTDRVRDIIRVKTSPRAAASSNSEINDAVRLHFTQLLASVPRKDGSTNLSASDLRAAYGKICEHFYCPETAEPIFYVGKILGHQTDNYTAESLSTTIHYTRYNIVDESGKRAGDIGIRLGQPGIKPLYQDAQQTVEVEPIESKPTEVQPESNQPTKRLQTKFRAWRDDVPRLAQLQSQLNSPNHQTTLSLALAFAENAIALAQLLEIEATPDALQQKIQDLLSTPKQLQPESEPQVESEPEPISETQAEYSPQLIPSDSISVAAFTSAMQGITELTKAVTDLAQKLQLQPQPTSSTRSNPSSKKSPKHQLDENLPDETIETVAEEPITEKQIRSTESAEEKVRRGLKAIMEYNSSPGRPHEDMWVITQSSLQGLTGSHRDVIQRILGEEESAIKKHNEHYDLGKFHNVSKGKKGIKIRDVMSW